MTATPRQPTVPGWEILGLLGSGGMAHVWKARRADGVLAALKVVKPLARVDAAQVASLFRRESLACLHIDHPNLVRALDAGLTSEGAAYLALELVEGRTLMSLVAEDGALEEGRALEVGIALARGLAEVHRLGLVHRDVTPRNVMLAPEGRVKLLDLGLVIEAAEVGGTHSMGTRGFVAPEILAGGRPDARSDLYSLGATLAVAATGELPGGESAAAGATKGVRRRRMSSALRQVVQRLLREEPAERYASAAETALDLEALAAGERPLGAILGSGGARVARRGPAIAAGFGCVAVLGGAVWWFAGRADDAPPPSAAPPAVASAPRTAQDPAVEAARVFVERFPDDFPRGRALLVAAESGRLTPESGEELARLRRALDERFGAAAEREFADRSARLASAAAAGDVPAARALAAGWPEALSGSPRAQELAHSAEQAAAAAIRANETLLVDVDRFVRTAETPAVSGSAESLEQRIGAAVARPPFDGDHRPELAAARGRIDDARRRATEASAARAAFTEWRTALAAHVASPSPERLRDALRAGQGETLAAVTRDRAQAVEAAWGRGETWVASRALALKGKSWCGPRGDVLFCGTADEAPTADEVFLSALWHTTGGRTAALAPAAKGADEAAAWLFARGQFDEARALSGAEGAVTALLADAPAAGQARPVAARWPVGIDADLALRPPGSRAAARDGADRVVSAWSVAASGAAGAAPVAAARNPAKAVGRDAFLAGDLGAAARALDEAAAADPRDAEIAALRGRTYLAGARTMTTPPALFAALSEGRRAWDLDPRLPAGPVLTAEAGIDLVELAGADVVARVRRVVTAACEAADSLGRADARMLAFAGEDHLSAGRAPQAVALLRRAAALAPDAGRVALLLARAEHATGKDDRARQAFRRAKELLGANLPDGAAELARALGL